MMKPYKSAMWLLGVIFSSIGLLFLALSLIFIVTSDILALKMTFGLQGGIWFIIGMSFYLYAAHSQSKLKRLKISGIPFPAKITRIVPNSYVRVSGYITAHLECTYENPDGKTCLVKSGSLLLRFTFLHIANGDNDPIVATVHVNRDNPRDYAIEVCENPAAQQPFDYDYR